jgi:hypothetical protein
MPIPGYIVDLKGSMADALEQIEEARGAIIRIDTTLANTLPEIKKSLEGLNGTVRKHDTDIALQKQAYQECPARQAAGKPKPEDSGGNTGDNPWSLAKWGLRQFGIFGAELAVIFALLVLLMRARGLL